VTGEKSICNYQSCLTNNEQIGNDQPVTFQSGVRAYGGYWEIVEVGTSSSTWPFSFSWANNLWEGHAVVTIEAVVNNNQDSAQPCSQNILDICTCACR
jgi:hypothetical protein